MAPASPGPLTSPGPRLDALRPALEWVERWGEGALALIVGGSHASGDAVWVEHDGRRWSLSDLDVHVVVPDRSHQRRAWSRARRDPVDPAGVGLLGPIEAAFLTPADLATLPARPGTLELRRHGVVVRGDAAWLGSIPDHAARDVSSEERLLLLENRAFELLSARDALAAASRLERIRARHEWLKIALDLATLAALEQGAYPDGARARVALAARGADAALQSLWSQALAWRAGDVEALAPDEALREWQAVANAWADAWWRASGRFTRAALAPDRVRACAARARLRRRARQAIAFSPRGGAGPTLWSRLLHAWRGTPQHRINGAAVAMVLAAAGRMGGDPRTSDATLRRTIRALGVVPRHALADDASARRAIVQTWDHWVLDGRRTARAS